MIIHIAGSSGSGKTTLGLRLKSKLRNKIIFKDLDDFNDICQKRKGKFDPVLFTALVKTFIRKHKNQNILFVGYNSEFVDSTVRWADISADYRFYIDAKPEVIIRQGTLRAINYLYKRRNDKKFIKHLMTSKEPVILVDVKKQLRTIKRDAVIYRKRGYNFKKQGQIYQACLKLLS
jgi:uridine kinase